MGTDPAQVIAGRYRLLGRIGSGGMGHVWHAWDERLSRAVAVKQLHSLAGLPEAEAQVAHERAMREARITARLHHPNAVPVFDVVDHDGRPCLVMQYLPSRSLQQLLADEGTLAPTEAARVGSQVASALAAAHRADIVHRDVKPGNVLIAEDGTARITDFGISHALGDASLTSTGMVTGTPAYLAPEVARGASSSPASDVFSLGATVYAATEGEPPFGTAANAMALLHRVASGTITPPTDGPLAPVLLRMLATAPEDRPSMQQAARELAAVAAGAAPSAGAATATTSSGAATEAIAVTRPATPLPPAIPVTPVTPSTPAAADAAQPPQVTPGAGATRALPVATASGTTASGTTASGTTAAPGISSGGAPRRQRRAPVAALAVLVAGALGVLGYSLVGGDDPGASPSGAAGAAPTSSAPSAPTPATTTSATPSSTPSSTPSGAASKAPTATGPTTSPATPSGTATTPGEPTSSAPSRTEAGGSLTSASDLAGAVRDYYGLLPGDTEAGWSRLSDRYRSTTARDRGTYESFWGSVRSVDVRQATGSAPGTAQATIRYEFRDGRRFEERTTYRFVDEDGLLKIDASSVRSSRQL